MATTLKDIKDICEKAGLNPRLLNESVLMFMMKTENYVNSEGSHGAVLFLQLIANEKIVKIWCNGAFKVPEIKLNQAAALCLGYQGQDWVARWWLDRSDGELYPEVQVVVDERALSPDQFMKATVSTLQALDRHYEELSALCATQDGEDVDPVVTLSSGLTAAVSRGDVSEVRRLLETEDVNQKSDIGYTPVHYAVWDDKPDILDMLIDAGAELECKADDGFTPFHLLASASGSAGCAAKLLENGAKVDLRVVDENPYMSDMGATPLRLAVLNQYWSVVELLLESGADISVLEEPCQGKPDGHSSFFEAVRGLEDDSDLRERFDADRLSALEARVKRSGPKQDSAGAEEEEQDDEEAKEDPVEEANSKGGIDLDGLKEVFRSAKLDYNVGDYKFEDYKGRILGEGSEGTIEMILHLEQTETFIPPGEDEKVIKIFAHPILDGKAVRMVCMDVFFIWHGLNNVVSEYIQALVEGQSVFRLTTFHFEQERGSVSAVLEHPIGDDGKFTGTQLDRCMGDIVGLLDYVYPKYRAIEEALAG